MENPKYYDRNVGANVCSDNAPVRSYLLVISRIYYPSCRGTKADVYAIFHLLVDFERNSFHFQKIENFEIFVFAIYYRPPLIQ